MSEKAPSPMVPERIATNILTLLSRTQMTGPEAIAWVEAVEFLKQFAKQPPSQA